MLRFNPNDHVAGTRALVKSSLYSAMDEVKVLEWSPAGRIKIQFLDGQVGWYDSQDYELVEVLP